MTCYTRANIINLRARKNAISDARPTHFHGPKYVRGVRGKKHAIDVQRLDSRQKPEHPFKTHEIKSPGPYQ